MQINQVLGQEQVKNAQTPELCMLAESLLP